MAKAISKAIINYKNQIQLRVNSNEIFNDKNPGENVKLIYKIQIAASKKKLDLKPYNFNGLKSISRIKNDRLFRYYYGSTTSYEKAKKLAQFAKKQGYKNAFIVPFLGNSKITISEALRLSK